MTFKIEFFDGQTSKTYHANLRIDALNWIISYIDMDSNKVDIYWNIDQIKKSTVYTKGLVVFSYGQVAPFQKIESSDENFIAYLEKLRSKKFANLIDVVIHKSLKRSLVFIIGIIIGFGILTYVYIIPKLTLQLVSNLSQKNVAKFGDYVFKVISNELEIDTLQTKNVQSFVDELTLKTSFPLEIYIAKSNTINAFALSGGRIVIYTSLLEKIENEAQLVALIGHEISHIENRDILKNITRDLSGTLFFSLLIGDINGISNVLMENAHRFTQLSYSRSLEKEADIYGIEIMKENRVDLHGMPQLFVQLKKESKFEISQYISNHPSLDDRIYYAKKIADAYNFNNHENKLLKEKWQVIKLSFDKN